MKIFSTLSSAYLSKESFNHLITNYPTNNRKQTEASSEYFLTYKSYEKAKHSITMFVDHDSFAFRPFAERYQKW